MAVALFPMVPMYDVLQQKNIYLVTSDDSRSGWVDFLSDNLGMDVTPNTV